jgi:uncharacterized protein with ParB-like and HNH nuclease domain
MEAKQQDLVSFLKLQDTRFVIPVYQRNYDWRLEHCEQLFDDIMDAGKADIDYLHFVGSIVYLKDSLLSTGPKELTIIDGQQRLTTITLLYAAIRGKYLADGDDKAADRIYRQFLVNEFAENESKLKLRPVKKDDRALRHVLDGNAVESFDGFSRLVDNYDYLTRRLDSTDLFIVERGLSKLIFVEMSLERGKDDPQRIFQSLNSTGLDLSQGDLIRNYVLMDLEPKSQERFFETYWVQIEENCREEETKEGKVSDFVRDFLTFKNGRLPKKAAVFEDFKKQYSHNKIDQLEQTLKELTRYSEHYRTLISPTREKDPAIREQIELLHQLDITVCFPFLLQVLEDFSQKQISRSDLISLLEFLQSYVWRRFIVSLPTHGLNKLFAGLCGEIDRNDYLSSFKRALFRRRGAQRWPDDNEIKHELSDRDMYKIQSNNRLYFLERLENHGERLPTKIYDNDEISVEHIYPQTASKEWDKLLGDKKDEMERLKNTAANLSLSVYNSDLGNGIFAVKRDLPEKGYKASPLRIDKLHAQYSAWDPVALKRRFEQIFKRFTEIWKYPYELRSVESVDDKVNILDIDDLTSCKIVESTFFGETKKNITFKDLLEFVASRVFELDPDIILGELLRTKLKITKNKDELRAAAHVGHDYFIEAALSGREILRRVKLIVHSAEVADELFLHVVPLPS